MKLQIVWRTLQPTRAGQVMIRQIVADAYGALYEVRGELEIKVFELLEYHAA